MSYSFGVEWAGGDILLTLYTVRSSEVNEHQTFIIGTVSQPLAPIEKPVWFRCGMGRVVSLGIGLRVLWGWCTCSCGLQMLDLLY